MTRAQESFPRRLHGLLDDVERRGLAHIISWLPGGKAFKIHAKELFIENILKRYFNTDKIKSFQRNLNLYGFNTVSKGREKGVCSHPLFIREDPDRCRMMTRVVVKGEGPRRRVPSTGEFQNSLSPVATHNAKKSSEDTSEKSVKAKGVATVDSNSTRMNAVLSQASTVTHASPESSRPAVPDTANASGAITTEKMSIQDPFIMLAAQELLLRQQQQQHKQREQELMQQLLAQVQQKQLLQGLQLPAQAQNSNNLVAALQSIFTSQIPHNQQAAV